MKSIHKLKGIKKDQVNEEKASTVPSPQLRPTSGLSAAAFSIYPYDPSTGYCAKEQKAWRIKPGSAVCHVCLKVVETRYCELCDLRYCNEGEDDDRPCAIEHDNRHEDNEARLKPPKGAEL